MCLFNPSIKSMGCITSLPNISILAEKPVFFLQPSCSKFQKAVLAKSKVLFGFFFHLKRSYKSFLAFLRYFWSVIEPEKDNL